MQCYIPHSTTYQRNAVFMGVQHLRELSTYKLLITLMYLLQCTSEVAWLCHRFDSDAKIDSNDEEGEESGGEGRPAAKPGPKKRKREAEDRPAQPAKRKKKEVNWL